MTKRCENPDGCGYYARPGKRCCSPTCEEQVLVVEATENGTYDRPHMVAPIR